MFTNLDVMRPAEYREFGFSYVTFSEITFGPTHTQTHTDYNDQRSTSVNYCSTKRKQIKKNSFQPLFLSGFVLLIINTISIHPQAPFPSISCDIVAKGQLIKQSRNYSS